MPLPAWGIVAGALAAVLVSLIWTTGGVLGALLVPAYALALCPTGWLLGTAAERLRRR